MTFDAVHYMEASASRLEVARRLHNEGRYSEAIYLAGVAIECLLRSFILRTEPQFDGCHDLSELYKKAQLEDLVHDEDRQRAAVWLGDVWARWKNNYRYASDSRLRTEFRRLAHNRGIQGDFLKENSRIVVDAALELRTLGERRCHSKKS